MILHLTSNRCYLKKSFSSNSLLVVFNKGYSRPPWDLKGFEQIVTATGCIIRILFLFNVTKGLKLKDRGISSVYCIQDFVINDASAFSQKSRCERVCCCNT